VLHIAKFLYYQSVLALEVTCTHFYTVLKAHEEPLWKHLAVLHFGFVPNFSGRVQFQLEHHEVLMDKRVFSLSLSLLQEQNIDYAFNIEVHRPPKVVVQPWMTTNEQDFFYVLMRLAYFYRHDQRRHPQALTLSQRLMTCLKKKCKTKTSDILSREQFSFLCG